MTNEQLQIEIKKVEDNKFLPEAVKKIKIRKLNEEFEKSQKGAGPAKPAPEPKVKKEKPKYSGNVYISIEKKGITLIDTKTKKPWANEYFDSAKEAKEFATQNNLTVVDAPSRAKATPDKPKKSKKATEYKFKGKSTKDLTDEECDELRKQVAERRKKAAKAEKKSKSKPIIEKIAANVKTGVKQAIENVAASDIKDDPKKMISKMDRIEKAAKQFLSELRTILGDDYDREAIDDEFKEIRELISGLKAKYK